MVGVVPNLSAVGTESYFGRSRNSTWSGRQNVLEGATEFAKSGSKLVKLEFPKTEIQMYGMTAVIYSTYSCELEMPSENGGAPKRRTDTGRITEVFVLRNGQWVNPGWHMDSGK